MSREGKPHSQKVGEWLLRAGGSWGVEEFLWGTVKMSSSSTVVMAAQL